MCVNVKTYGFVILQLTIRTSMATTVTVSKFRENLSKYIDLVNEKGKRVKVIDDRKGKVFGKFVKGKKIKEFDLGVYLKFMKNFKPFWAETDSEYMKKLRKVDRERLKKLNKNLDFHFWFECFCVYNY